MRRIKASPVDYSKKRTKPHKERKQRSIKNEQSKPLGTINRYPHLIFHSFLALLHRPSADVNESANPDGLVGMLVWVLSVLARNEEEEEESPMLLFPSYACHFFNACGKVMSRSMPYMSSESGSAGFHNSARDESTLTT